MPGSAVSAGSGSQLSSGSRRAKTRHYYKVAATSQVDESLFGASHSQAKRAEMLQDKWRQDPDGDRVIEQEAAQRKQRRSGARSKRETVQVITKDLIRNLVVPHEDPSGQTLVMTRADLDRLRSGARVLTPEEKKTAIEAYKRYKESMMDDVQERKNYMKEKDLERHQNAALSELEEAERQKAEYLRQKANQQLQEQEDEIKKLNELILNAKCHAIRDAQLVERSHISQEMDAEERRLDQMMEVDRVSSIKVEEEIEKARKEQRLLGAMKIMDQIQENEQERLLELEKKDRENRTMQKYLDKLCEEEAEKLDRRHLEQTRLREELNQCNTDLVGRKQLAKEQERMIEAKVLEYQKDKAEREAAYEAEQERVRVEKEREVARLRTLQERARDEQAERDALRAKRAQEQAEREWRQKEAGEAAQKAEVEAMLKVARAQQMKQKEHFLAVQAQRERADFERVLHAQQELVEKDRRGEEEKRQAGTEYADQVRQQIREREQQRISQRNAFFDEGVKLDDEAKQRRQRLEDIKRQKLDELRAMGLADKYVNEVARKANVPVNC